MDKGKPRQVCPHLRLGGAAHEYRDVLPKTKVVANERRNVILYADLLHKSLQLYKVYPCTGESSPTSPIAGTIVFVASWRLGGGEGLQEMELEETTLDGIIPGAAGE